MPTDHLFEDEFARALRDAAELAPEPMAHHLLTAGAEQHGRRWRRRRRTALAGGLAALVIAGAGGFMALGNGPVGAAGPTGPAPTGLPTMSKDEVVALVGGLLPPGKVTVMAAGAAGAGTLPGHEDRADGTLLLDDGSGASIFEYTAERTGLAPATGAVCMDGFSTPQDSCDRTSLPDGSVVVIDKLRSEHTPGGREWRATWAGPDGRRVSVIEFNGQPAAANRTNPPLSAEQLTAFVTAPAWSQVFAALPPQKGAPTASAPSPTASGPGAAELLARLVPLLPPGATSKPAAAPGHASLSVTLDGRTSMVAIGLEPASQRGLDLAANARTEPPTPLEVRETLPDGTLVITNRFGNGKTATDPVLHWTAEVYAPDGRHVSIAEWNGENAYTTRPGTPALSPEQLRAIVTDPGWRT